MRLSLALASAAAYLAGRRDPPSRPAPGSASEPVIIEPWRSPGIPDQPDPVALFLTTVLRPATGSTMTAAAVAAAYEAWAGPRGHGLADPATVVERLDDYTTSHVVNGERIFVGLQPHPFAGGTRHLLPGEGLRFGAAARLHPIPARAIPGLRARIQADSTLLAAELSKTLQSVRDVLEPATDLDGPAGDHVRLAASLLDDALADFATEAATA